MKTTASLCVFATLAGACGPILKGGMLVKPVKTDYVTDDKPADPTPTNVEVPYVPSPQQDEGTMVINVVDGPAKVSLVTGRRESAVKVEGHGTITSGGVSDVDLDTKLLCSKTPCAVALPVGSQTLDIEAPESQGWDSSTDLYDVDILPKKAQMVTHVMSRHKHSVLDEGKPGRGLVADILLETFGWTGVCVGVPLAAIDSTRTAGLISLVVGGLMVIGGYASYHPPTEGHEADETRPDATTLSDFPPH